MAGDDALLAVDNRPVDMRLLATDARLIRPSAHRKYAREYMAFLACTMSLPS